MIFIIGGAYQGKYNYAKLRFSFREEDVFYGEWSPYSMLMTKSVIKDFHLLIKRFLQEGRNIKEEVEQLLSSNVIRIIITDEIGYGIVPMDKFERSYREETGRVCCLIAENSDEVIRVHCGIPLILKGNN